VLVDPDFPEARTVLIRVLVAREDFEEARDQARRLLVVRPDEAASHALIALVDLAAGDSRQAGQAVERALERDEGCPLAREVRGRLALGRGDARAAVPDLRAALESRPGDPDLRYFLALALLRSDEVDRAATELDRVLESHSGHARALSARALIEAIRGHRERALELIDRACGSSNPAPPEVQAIRRVLEEAGAVSGEP
jgi:predicted Zn-dependent protease